MESKDRSEEKFNPIFPKINVNGSPNPISFTDFPRTIHPLIDSSHMQFGTEEINPNSEIPWHSHQHSEEIIFIFRGNGIGYIGDQEKPLHPGTVLHVTPNSKHRLVNTSSTESMWITYCFSPPVGGVFTIQSTDSST